MKYISLFSIGVMSLCTISCSKNTEPKGQEVRHDLIGTWDMIGYTYATNEFANYYEWIADENHAAKGYNKHFFEEGNTYHVTLKSNDVANIEKYEGVYFVSAEGDTLTTSMPYSTQVSNVKQVIHYMQKDTMILRRYINDNESYMYSLYVR